MNEFVFMYKIQNLFKKNSEKKNIPKFNDI